MEEIGKGRLKIEKGEEEETGKWNIGKKIHRNTS